MRVARRRKDRGCMQKAYISKTKFFISHHVVSTASGPETIGDISLICGPHRRVVGSWLRSLHGLAWYCSRPTSINCHFASVRTPILCYRAFCIEPDHAQAGPTLSVFFLHVTSKTRIHGHTFATPKSRSRPIISRKQLVCTSPAS